MGELNYSDCPAWFDIYLKYQKLYKRIGECSNCGDCCKTVIVEVDWSILDYKIVDIEYEDCKVWDKEHKRCRNYLFRSLMCRIFPMKPSDLKWLPNCTYKFEFI